MCCNAVRSVLSSLTIISLRKREVVHGCLFLIVFLLACINKCSVTPTHNAMGWCVIVTFSSHTQLLYDPVVHRNRMDHAVQRITKKLEMINCTQIGVIIALFAVCVHKYQQSLAFGIKKTIDALHSQTEQECLHISKIVFLLLQYCLTLSLLAATFVVF